MKKQIADIAGLTPGQLSDHVVGHVQFSGRDDWEQRLYTQKEKFVAVTHAAINNVQRMWDTLTEEEKDPRKIRLNLITATSPVGVEYVKYDDLVQEGVKKAAE